ncbi:MAG TPA: uracil-DNA glycosylase family protein [Gemmatimonadaceae bacterium]|nr:uracil-DNA glycosylase family protein [Gemmatimonadaceae bacterium]
MSGSALDRALDRHRRTLGACRRCAHQNPLVVPILSQARAPRIVLVGQAPGRVECGDRRPFAGRAGRTLFRWLEQAGIGEELARDAIYIAAITRCYPGPSPSGRGDRVPSPDERESCASWLDDELRLIRPVLVIPVGRLAIDRFLGPRPLVDVVGRTFSVTHAGGESTAIALPHPSGASSWPNQPGNRDRLDRAISLLRERFAEPGTGAAWAPRGQRSA